MEKKLIIIGAGKRSKHDAIPVIQKISSLSIYKIYAKNRKIISINNKSYNVEELNNIKEIDVKAVDLIYLAVSKNEVVSVLQKLQKFPISNVDLLIETPVLPFSHIGEVSLFDGFKNVWVAEDCIELPCFDVLEKTKSQKIQILRLFRSAYKYHAIALIKKLLNNENIKKVKSIKNKDGFVERVFSTNNNKTAHLIEPRDYCKGFFLLDFGNYSISDKFEKENIYKLEPIVSGSMCIGFRYGNITTNITKIESEILGIWPLEASITSKMHDLKRVGLYRLFTSVSEGEGAHSLSMALNDAEISYFLENIGYYIDYFSTVNKTKVGRKILKTAVLIKRYIDNKIVKNERCLNKERSDPQD